MSERSWAGRRALSVLVAAALTLAGSAVSLAATERAAGAALDTTMYAVAADQRIYSFNESTGAATPISPVQPFESAAIARQPGTGLLYVYEQTSTTGYRVATYNVATQVTTVLPATIPYGLLRLAFRPDGELYGGVNGSLYHLSPTTGAVLGTTALTGVAVNGGDLTFAADGSMYLVGNSTLWTFAPFASSPGPTLAPSGSVTLSNATPHTGLAFGRAGKLFAVDQPTTTTLNSTLSSINLTTGAETRLPTTSFRFLDLTTAPNRPPVAGAVADLTTPRDTPVTTSVTRAASDPDGDLVTVVSGSSAKGVVTVDGATGMATFTPTRGFSGQTTFTYTLSDGNGGTATGTVNVLVGPNTDPVAVNDSISVAMNAAATTVPVKANDSDANGDTLTVTAVGTAAHGTVTLTSGAVTYKPVAAYSGPDSFTYTISDGFGGAATATVSVTVTKPNTAPVYTAAASNTSQTIPAGGTPAALAATDADGDTLSFSVSGGALPAGITLNSGGTFSGTATGFGASTVTIAVSDGKGGTASTTLTITVQNGPPVAAVDAVSTPQDTAVTVSPLTNDSDPNGDALGLTSATGAANGTLTVDTAAKTVTYTPKAGFSGSDSFTYVVSDGRGGSTTGTVSVTVTFVNSPPVFTPTTNNTAQTLGAGATPVALSATDPDGDSLTYSLAPGSTLPGTLTLNPGGTFSGAVSTAGSYSATIRVSDGHGGTATTTLQITVTNSPPTPADDAYSTSAGTPVTSPVRWNDTDANGDTLVVSAVSQGGNGTVVIDVASGNPTYTPAAGFVGTDTYTYTVRDPGGASAQATVTVTVGNAQPSFTADATNDAQTVSAGSVPVPLTASDPNNDTLTYVRVGGVLPPGLTLGTNGTFTGLTSTAGSYSATIEVRDGRGGVDTTTLVITVPNAPPVAVDDNAVTPAATSVLTAVRFNDTDANGDSLTVTSVGAAGNGTVTQDPVTGNPTYTPNTGFSGTDSYTYTVSDGHGGTATGTVRVTVGNAAPVFTGAAQNTAQTVQPGFAPARVLATDPNNDQLTYALVSGVLPGSVVLAADGTFSGIVTTAGSYPLRISTDDGKGGVDTTTLVVTVPNVAPTAVADSAAVPFGGTATTPVRFNDTDPNGDTLVVTAVTQGTTGGTVAISASGSVVYTAKPGYSGPDTYAYTVDDGHGGTATGTVSISVGNGVPSYTSAVTNTAQTVAPGDIPTALDATDPNGDALTYTLVSGQLPDGVTLSAGGVFAGSPTTAGSYPVRVTVSDGKGGTAATDLTITVPNVRPVAANDAATTAYATAVQVLVLGNDADANGDDLVVVSATNGTRGSVVVNGGQSVTYTPAAGFSGVDTFTYTVSDGVTTPHTATVTVTVANAPPAFTSAGTNSAQTVQPGATPMPLLAADPNGDPLLYALASGTLPSGVGLSADGTFTGTAQRAGTFIVTVSVTDRRGTPVAQQLTLTVPNVAPLAVADADTTGYLMPATTDVLANDTDANADPITVTAVTDGAHGTVAISAGGLPVYTPASGFSGTDSYTYTVSDGASSATAVVTLTVGNGRPAFTGAAANTAQTVEPVATPARLVATDPNGDALSYAVASGALPAGVSLVPNGTFAGTPSTAGTYTAVITVDDGKGGSATTTLVITVPNRPPTAAPDTAGTAYLTPVATVVRFNDRDPNGDALTVSATTDGVHGTVSLNAAGNPVYTPAAGFSGTDTYGYTVSDPGGLTASSTVAVTVGDAAPSYTSAATNTAQTVQPGGRPVPLLATDPNTSDVLTYAVSGGALPTGLALNSDGTFTGAAQGRGSSSVTVTVSDGKGGDDVVTLVITLANVGPTAVDDSDGTASGIAVVTDVRANDTDPNGDALTIASFTQPSHGTVARSGGGLRYTPAPGYAGFDSYRYTVEDPAGLGSTATVTIAVGNAAPVFTTAGTNTAQTVQPGTTPVRLDATDPNNDALAYRITAGALPSRMTLNADGTFGGTATAAGTYTVTAEVRDPSNATDTVVLTLTVPNAAPSAADDTDATAAGTAVETAVRANDRDPNGDALTVSLVTQPAHGAVVLNPATGDPVYTPSSGYRGDDTYTYRVSDAAGLTSSPATVTVSVGNTAPAFTGAQQNTSQDVVPGATPLDLVATDANGDTLAYSLTAGSLPPGVTLGVDGRFRGAPTTAASYTATITVDDGHLGTATTRLVLTVLDVAPLAVDDTASTTYDTPVTTAVLVNDTDANRDRLVVTAVGAAMNGTVSFTAGGTTYTPASGFSGSDQYGYTVADPAGHMSQAIVRVTVGNAAPQFTSVSTNTVQQLQPGDTPTAVIALDPNVADTVTYSVTGTLPDGVSFAADGTFTGAVQKAGTFTLQVTATDGKPGGTTTQQLVLSVGQVGPLAIADRVSTAYLTAVTLDPRTNDVDDNGDPLTVTAAGPASSGTVTFTGSSVTYTPAGGFSGTETFPYTVSDGTSSVAATITVTVADGPPTFTAAPTNRQQDLQPGDAVTSVVATDPNPSDTLTYALLGGTLPRGMSLAADGSFNGRPQQAGDFPVTIEVSDGHGRQDRTTLLLRVANVAPVAVDDVATTGNATPVGMTVTTNDSDPNGDALTIVATTAAAHGTVSVSGASVTYTPSATFAGVDTFTYTVADSGSPALTATATVTVTVANAPPVFTSAASNTAQSLAPGVTPTAVSATDANNDPVTYRVSAGSLPAGITLLPNGSFSGPTAKAGTYGVTITVTDRPGATGTTFLILTVANIAPVAVDDTASAAYLSPVTTDVLANDSDANGDSLTVVALTSPAHGTVGLTAGRPTYTPFAGYAGPDRYDYTVSDGTTTATATVRVTVGNAAPLAVDDSATTTTGRAVAVAVLTNDSDPNGDTLTITAVGSAAHGTVTFTATGTTYQPSPAFAGSDSYTYSVSDGTTTASATVRIAVSNAAPVFTSAPSNTAQTVPAGSTPAAVLATDLNGDGLTYALVSGTLPAGVTLAADGSFNGTVSTAGTYVVRISVSDGTRSDLTDLTITVPNAPPAFTSATTNRTQSLSPGGTPAPLLAVDANGDAITYAVTTGTLPAGLTLRPDGTFAGTLTTAGSVTVTVTVTDAAGATGSTVLTLTVANLPPAFTNATTNTTQTVPQGATPASLAATDPNGGVVTYAITSGAAPTGLVLLSDGTWSGTPTGPGVTTFDVTVTDGTLTDVTTLTITVPAAPPVLPTGPNVVETVAAGATPPAVAATVFGGGTPVFTQTGGTLPPGVTLQPDGSFTGTVAPVGTWTIDIAVTSGGASSTGTVTIVVPNSAPVFTPAAANTNQSVVAGDPFRPLAATDANGDGPLTYAVTAGTLPPGVALNPDGTFTGTARPVGTWTVTVSAADNHSGITTTALTLTVPNSPPALVAGPLTTAVGATPPALVGTDPNGDPLTYADTTGALPPGVTLLPNGSFSGAPTTPGTYPFSVTVSDSHNASTTVPMSIAVPAAPAVPVVPAPAPPVVTVTAPSAPSSPAASPTASPSASPVVSPSASPVVSPSASPVPVATTAATPSPSASVAPTAAPVVGPVAHVPTPAAKPGDQAVEQSRTTGLDQPLALDLTGRTGSPTHIRVVAGPEHGTVTLAPDGTAVYTPTTGFSGIDEFTYAFTGGSGVAVTGTMHIRVGTGLPRTGAETGQTVGVGVLLLVGGLLLLVVGRRRRRSDEPA